MKTTKHIFNRKSEILVLIVLVFEFIFPHYSIAAEAKDSYLLPDLVIKSQTETKLENNNEGKVKLLIPLWQGEAEKPATVEVVPEPKVVKTQKMTITAYSSTPDQTDSTPCITANGFDLCKNDQENVIAANFLPFGTKVRIPEYFGDRVFTVQDRMNARYYYRADVWTKTRQSAKIFGARYTTIEVLE